jgi:transcriptional regulator with PAS, ATPase and Fis domain
MDRYARAMYRSMGKVSTLILGPSGTGKELVAEAISNARYLRFDTKEGAFADAGEPTFYAVNVAALPPTLIESELFGHGKGAFSGAHKDHRGWLETCGAHGTVFLDEIGDLDVSLQVKLLRVLQTGDFHRVGETKKRRFEGKVIAATNRNLAEAIREGRFREDLYYRLCADLIHTPTLREQLADAPDDLETHVQFITRRMFQEAPEEADPLARTVVEWIRARLERDYAWPGNIRELEQCVRNVMIRGAYVPSRAGAAETSSSERQRFAQQVIEASLTLAELTERYSSLAYVTYGTYEAAAEKLGVNYRTLRRKVRPELTDLYRLGGADSK